MGHIKHITIQGFKTYKNQVKTESFSPKTNVIVGRNGAGKTNFFSAVRFVLGDEYENMSSQERQALLHVSCRIGPALLAPLLTDPGRIRVCRHVSLR